MRHKTTYEELDALQRHLRLVADTIAAGGNTTDAVTVREAAALLAGVAATLPTCPVCGGKQRYLDARSVTGATHPIPCPAGCVDGKVTVEQLASTFARVWLVPIADRGDHGGEFGKGWCACIDHLRSVRPPSPEEGT